MRRESSNVETLAASASVAKVCRIWANNPRRAMLKGRHCVVLARGALGSVLVHFPDTEEKVVTSRRALRSAA
jgi:hypothetical protein